MATCATLLPARLCERDRSDTPVAIFGVFQDITEHTRALAAARRNEGRYRLLAENMADVVTRIRPDGSSNYISPAIERLLGYPPEEMAGRSAQDFVHPEDQAAVASCLRDALPERGAAYNRGQGRQEGWRASLGGGELPIHGAGEWRLRDRRRHS
jgi:PAS domain S-box-containing protein